MSNIPSEDDKKKAASTTPAKTEHPAKAAEPVKADPVKEAEPAKASAKKPHQADYVGPIKGFFFEYGKDLGYAGNRYQTAQANSVLSSTPESRQKATEIDAGVAFGTFRDNGHTLLRVGAQIKDISNVLNDQRVYLTNTTTPTTGAATVQTQLGEAPTGTQLSKLHFAGGAAQLEHKVSAFLVGGGLGVGSLKSELNTTAYQSSATNGKTFDPQAFPGTSTKRELGGTAKVFVGVQPIPHLPTIIGGADAIVSNNVRATNVFVKAVQEVPLGNSGISLTGQFALNQRGGTITHDASSMKIDGHGLNKSYQIGFKWNVPSR